jgi:hypothetical protein
MQTIGNPSSAARFGFDESCFKASDADLMDEAIDPADPRLEGIRPSQISTDTAVAMTAPDGNPPVLPKQQGFNGMSREHSRAHPFAGVEIGPGRLNSVFDAITENAAADDLKQRLRDTIEKVKSPSELFFYFTGHGYVRDGELFHCATNFDGERPNETGLSTSELHTILRLADANLVVKVIDAC